MDVSRTLRSSGAGVVRRHRIFTTTAAVGVAWAAWASAASATTFQAHDGASLAAALRNANAQLGPSTIELSPGPYTPTETLTIGGDVTFTGSSGTGPRIGGAAVLPIGSSVFVVGPHAKATFVNLTVTNAGAVGGSAAIDVAGAGAVDLENSTLAGNLGPGLTVEPGASAMVRNSTLSDGLGVGLVVNGTTRLINSTVADNAVEGIDDSNGTLNLVNTIVAGNGSPDCSARAASSVQSLDSDGSCGVGALSRTDPLLGPLLASNGGPTPTRALASGSPAINAGDASQCPREDQRHYARSDGKCDVGAYEAGAHSAGAADGGPPSGSHPTRRPAVKRPAVKRRAARLRGHGAVRGPKNSRITFSVRAVATPPHGSLVYRDAAGRIWFRSAKVASAVINATRGTATIKGSGTELVGHRRVTFTAVLTDHAGMRRLRLTLSSGYAGGGRLISGALTLFAAGA